MNSNISNKIYSPRNNEINEDNLNFLNEEASQFLDENEEYQKLPENSSHKKSNKIKLKKKLNNNKIPSANPKSKLIFKKTPLNIYLIFFQFCLNKFLKKKIQKTLVYKTKKIY